MKLKTYVIEFTIETYIKIGEYWESCDVGFQEFYTARSARGARCLVLADYLRPPRPDAFDKIKFTRIGALDY